MADLISASLMTELRALDASAMPSTCVVLRSTRTYSGGREVVGEPEPVIPDPTACRVSAPTLNPQEGQQAGRIESSQFPTVAFPLPLPAGLSIRGDDLIEATTVVEGVTFVDLFQVNGDPVVGSYSTNLTVDCREIE